MTRAKTLFWATVIVLVGVSSAGAGQITLTGRIRDFCAPGITGCTQLADFEGSIPGLVQNMTLDTLIGGVPVAGPNIVAGASTAANFAKWYTDSPGYNMSQDFSLTLTEGAPGVYSYSSNSFFPIDNQLYGNQGRDHNYHFTLQLAGFLSFSSPTQTFSFTGDDDLWIFVNGKRFMDLGGVHTAVTGTFTGQDLLDAGLLANTQYSFDMFFAERHTTESNLSITTSLTLTPVPDPGSSLLLLGMGLVGLRAWRKRWQ